MSKNKPKSKQTTTKPKRRTFSEEFKLEAVKLVTEQNYKVAEAARNLGITDGLLRRWIDKDANHEDDTENEELKQLRAENKRLRMERDILKKATAFFANEKN
jgi:transposase